MFSLGNEGLNIRPPRVALPNVVFTCLLVCVLYSDNCRGYASFKGSSELTPCGLMIAWASGWRASKLCMWPCRNRSWRLPLRALRHRMWNSPNMLTISCAPRPTANRYRGRHGRQDMAAVVSTRRHGRSSSRSPEYFDTGEQQAEREREVTMTQPAAYARYSQRVWTNANTGQGFPQGQDLL